MWYLANPSTARIRATMRDDSPHMLGAILSPQQGNRLPAGATFCIDNNCGPVRKGRPGDAYPGDPAYLALLAQLAEADGADPCDPDTSHCLFAAAPDVLGDAAATLKRSAYMLPWIRYIGVPAALVAQDGLEDLDVPWDEFDVLFLGGSTGWKLGPAAAWLAGEAKARGKRVHMGRVNSLQRLWHAVSIGCDSCDGTYLAFAPDANLDRLLPWLAAVNDRRAA